MLWLRALAFALALPGTVLVWVPLWLSTRDGFRVDAGGARWAGMPLIVVGAAGLIWCIWDFARRGRGTLAPVDAPRFVVRAGLYQVVRNPMYVAVFIALVGESLVLGSLRVLAWAGVFALVVHAFVVLYEEPTLARTFGADYEAYRRAVPRWLPRRAA